MKRSLPAARRAALAIGAVLILGPVLAGCSLIDQMIGSAKGEDDVFSIVIGDCLNDAEISQEVTTVPIVDCAEPHDSEVFARTDSRAASFPGNTDLEDELFDYCVGDVFEEFVGIPYADSMYETSGYYPTQDSWSNGDRELLCTIWDPNGRVTGSLEGIGQ